MSRLGLSLALAAFIAARAAAAADGVTVQYFEPLRAYAFAPAMAAQSASTTPQRAAPRISELRFNALGRDFVVALEPNARLAPTLARLGNPAGLAAYRGSLVGRPGSWARIVVTPQGPAGLIADGGTIYALESPRDSAVATGSPAIFRLADVYIAPGDLACGTAATATDASAAVHALAAELETLAQAGATLNLDLGAVADVEFTAGFGDAAGARAALLTRLNNVDGIFSEQVGIQITPTQIDVFEGESDPFDTSNADDLLAQLATYRGATPLQEAQGVTHLFTGRNLDGSTAGIAYIGAVCGRRSGGDPLQRSFGAGLSEARRGATIDSLVAAHEIGHNFGAPHDAEAGSACETTPPTFLMAPSVSGVDRFSMCSLEQMQLEIANASCLTPIGPADLALTTLQRDRTVHAGVAFDYALTIANRGVAPATAASLTVTLENDLRATAATAGCGIASQTVTCALDTIDGGTARDVTLTLLASAPGAYDLGAAVASADDTATSNNSLADTVTAIRAVDLVLAGAAASVQTDQQTTVTVTLDNAADFTANHVNVAVTPSAGVRVDSAALDAKACTIGAQGVACSAASIAVRGRVTLALTITGVAAGAQQLAVTTSADEADSNPQNNSLSLPVDITGPPADGGGGGLSWLAVLALAGIRLLGTRRPTVPRSETGRRGR
jgi:metallopeptidase family M12-like protein/uncharacterized protein DUF11